MLRLLDTFSGVGGFSLAARMAGGFETTGFCEIDPFCRAVLAKHWPGVWQHDDLKTLTGELVAEHCGRVDIITGGIPCQPASCAGKRKGSDDERWLWPAFLRLVREVKPLFVLAENVPGIIGLKPHGLDWIVAEMEAAGYECLSFVLGAWAVGAPHKRDRVWIVGRLDDAASPRCSGNPGCESSGPVRNGTRRAEPAGRCGARRQLADPSDNGSRREASPVDGGGWRGATERTPDVSAGQERRTDQPDAEPGAPSQGGGLANPQRAEPGRGTGQEPQAERGRDRLAIDGSTLADPQLDARRQQEPGRQEDRGTAAGGAGEGGSVDFASDDDWLDDILSCSGTIPIEPELQAYKPMADTKGPRREGTEREGPALPGRCPAEHGRWPSRPGQPQFDWEPPRLLSLSGIHPGVRAFLRTAHPSLVGASRTAEALQEEVEALARAEAGKSMESLGCGTSRIPLKLVRRANKLALKAYGNSIVPQVAAQILRWIGACYD